MPAPLQIRDLPSGISATVKKTGRVGNAIIILIFGVIALCLAVRMSGDSSLLVGGVISILSLASAFSVLRGTEAELQVTDTEFISSGYAPEGHDATILLRADIYRLEYREASGGGDSMEFPEGLYVLHQSYGRVSPEKNTCVLPNIDRSQAEAVIQAIYHRFPDTEKSLSSKPFESYPITLNLNASDKDKAAQQ